MGHLNAARFFENAASTNSSGMIDTLLQIAAMRGIVELAGDPDDYFVGLKSGAAPSIENLQEVSVNRNDVPTRMIGLESVDRPSPGGSHPVTEHAAGERRTRQPDKYRSDQYSDHIAKARMGPFPVARPRIYDALKKLVDSRSKLPLSSLIESAIEIARKQVPQPQPWEAMRHVTQNQLLKAQIALDADDKPLPDRWDSGWPFLSPIMSPGRT
jgi:hypothetical protein